MYCESDDRKKLLRLFNLLNVLGSFLILVSLSFDILVNRGYKLTHSIMTLQFIVCSIALIDIWLHWREAHFSAQFLWRNIVWILLSIPYLNFARWFGVHMSNETLLILKAIPLIRGFWSVGTVVGWLAKKPVRHLFFAYLFAVLVFTYFSALLFYNYELGVNPKVTNFGNSLWWAWMGVTTVGAEIFPVAAIGKFLAVCLPALGMVMFPLFTIYMSDVIADKRAKEGE